jgi:hypothetical protein
MTEQNDNAQPLRLSNPDSSALIVTNVDCGQMVNLSPPPIFQIRGANGQPLVTVHPDGRLEHGDGYDPDEAARAFWDAVQRLTPPAMVREYGSPLTARVNAELAAGQRAQKQVERLDSMATAWKERLPETINRDTAVEAIHHVTREGRG